MLQDYYFSVIINCISILCNGFLVHVNKNNGLLRLGAYVNVLSSVIHLLATLANYKIPLEIEIVIGAVQVYVLCTIIYTVYKNYKRRKING